MIGHGSAEEALGSVSEWVSQSASQLNEGVGSAACAPDISGLAIFS